MEKIRMAVLGLNQGAKSARDASKLDEVDLVAVAGVGGESQAVANETGATLYSDYLELINTEVLDAIVISLPNALHKPAVEASLTRGIKNILLEKPVADTVEEAESIIAQCKEAGATLLIGHHRRSSSKYLFLKEFLESGKLGEIVGVQGNYAIAKPYNYYDIDWHRTTGPLLINAIHDVDDFNNVLPGSAKRVFAVSRNNLRGNEAEDNVSVVIEYEGGPTVTYFVSDGTPGPWNYDLQANENDWFTMCEGENSIRFYGTEGSFGFPNMDFYHYEPEHYGWAEPLTKEHFDVELNNPMAAEMDHFVDLCLGRETVPRCTGEDGLATLKVINAIIESGKTGQVVEID